MRFQYRILILLFVAVVAIGLSPFLTGDGVRFWIWWKARQEKLTVKIDKMEAPFLGPVTLRGVRVTSSPDSAFRTELSAAQVSIRLNFEVLLLRARGRPLRNISATGLRVEIHRNPSGAPFPENSWVTWQKLLPDSADLRHVDLRVENGPVVILVRGGTLSFSEMEAGRFLAEEFTISSPLVRQTFSRLRGAAHWQRDHLAIAGLSLTRGLDLQSLTADLSHLSKQRLAMSVDIDAFGGKLRGNIANEWRSRHSTWNIVGSASDISLAQTSEAVGLADRIAGRMHACKFTFRGDLQDPMNATASVWTELTAPAWRNREADVIMVGAAFYNRQIDLQQLYVKQNKNELTLSGEAPIPGKWSDWLTPDFRADINASIANLGDFVRLFGVNPEEFGGKIVVEGTINSRGKKLGGQISVAGSSLLFFHSPVDLLSAHLSLAAGVAEVSEFYLKRKEDYAKVEGKIDILHDRHPVGSLEFNARKLSDYFPKSPFAGSLQGRFEINGQIASCDALRFNDGPATVSLSSRLDFTDMQNVRATLAPLIPLADLSPPNASDCIDRIQLTGAAKKKQTPPSIESVDLLGDFAGGLREIKLKTAAGEKAYRVFCTDAANRALPIGATRQ